MKSHMISRIRSVYWVIPLALLVVLCVANILVDPGFLEPAYLPGMLAAFAPLAILAMASTPAILAGGGGIDISLAPLGVFTSILLVTQVLPTDALNSPVTATILALVIGTTVGTINGLLVTVLRFQPILATLCGLFILTGLNLKLAPMPVPAGDNWTAGLAGTAWGVPIALLLIAVPVVIWIALSRTAWMRNLYAVGGDQIAAYSAGVNVRGVRLLAYALGGFFAGLAGIAILAIIRAGDATIANQYLILALTAVALGGTSFMGGRGGLLGSLIGASSIFMLQLLLTTLGLRSAWLQVAYGGVLLLAVILAGRLAAARSKGARA